MNPAEAANTIATWALVVSIVAIVVAFIAAVFTGWQAITMHLDRTRPRPARLVLPAARPGKARTIKNEGGSAAHSVQLLVWGAPSTARGRRDAVRRMRRDKAPRIMFEPSTGGRVTGSVPAGDSAPIEGYGKHPEMFMPPEGMPGTSSGLEVLYSTALAYWTDWSGKRRHAWIEIR